MKHLIPQKCWNKIKKYFDDDPDKTWTWFQTINPSLGGLSPLNMIKRGRIKKLEQFIDNAIDENKRFYP